MDILIRFDYIVEILLAEWVFLHIYPKRRCFFVRLLVTTAVSLAVGYGCYPKSISQQVAAKKGGKPYVAGGCGRRRCAGSRQN